MKTTTTWEGNKTFIMKNEIGKELRMDAPTSKGGDGSGVSPMESVLGGLAGCMGIDINMVLRPYLDKLQKLEFETVGLRNEEPPMYFKAIETTIHVEGDIPASRVWRAVSLSEEKYCSVAHSLNADLTFKVILNGEEVEKQ
ncbi:OsmC family protein [Alkalibacterium iburiense]|uniref:OsmC family protein n=1 Tax=Alkalibacterium iburiense TaxID=290589 RepID=A0ABN0X4J5_9LACT